MINTKKKNQKKHKAFSLAEALITLLVICIVVMASVPVITKKRKKMENVNRNSFACYWKGNTIVGKYNLNGKVSDAQTVTETGPDGTSRTGCRFDPPTNAKNFVVTDQMFSREVRECTVGILGCGKIGRTTGQLFKGLGAKVIGYDAYPNKEAEKVLTFVELDDLIKNSDIICCHLPYIKGSTDNFINKEFVSKMKDHAILINSARGEVMDFDAVLDAVESGKLDGLALDVVKNEKALFFKDHGNESLQDPVHQRIIDLFPKVIITPHIGSATTMALQDMVEISLQNLDEILKNGTCKNSLNK